MRRRTCHGCGLKPIGMVQVAGVHRTQPGQSYLVNTAHHQGPTIPNFQVTLAADLNGADSLIGIDITTLGDLSITNHQGNAVVSFRIPSLFKVNYVAEMNRSQQTEQPRSDFRVPGKNNKRRR